MLGRLSMAFLALACIPAALEGLAQAPANLAGRWMFADERSPDPAFGPRPNYGTEFVIRQDESAITVESGSGPRTIVSVYPLDGRETERMAGSAVVRSRARWQDGKFVIDVTNTSAPGADGRTVTTVSTRRFWIEGDALLSEWVITSPVQSTSVSVYRHPPAGPPPPIQPAKAVIASMEWLVGAWEGKRGSTTIEERWTPAAGGAMLAVARTVSGARMVAFEFLRIVERDGTLVYLAQPNGRAPATEFTLTRITATGAVFENPAHDFPKMISYSLAADGTLTAEIADVAGLKPQRFVFRKAGPPTRIVEMRKPQASAHGLALAGREDKTGSVGQARKFRSPGLCLNSCTAVRLHRMTNLARRSVGPRLRRNLGTPISSVPVRTTFRASSPPR